MSVKQPGWVNLCTRMLDISSEDMRDERNHHSGGATIACALIIIGCAWAVGFLMAGAL